MEDRVEKLVKRIVDFRNARDWKQFHNIKDMSLSLVLEASEVLEHSQWKNEKELEEYVKSHKDEIGEELADALYWILLIAHDNDIDVFEAANKKLTKNEAKYPVEKAKGRHEKYNQL